jgi:hypothetical protein
MIFDLGVLEEAQDTTILIFSVLRKHKKWNSSSPSSIKKNTSA